MWAKKQQNGFTIVELLIVIVVIGILAAITIVAYSGIQNRAYDAAIRSDLAGLAKKLMIYRIDNTNYPVGDTELATMNLRFSKSAYENGFSGVHNLLYCRVSADGPDKFALIASSKSGSVFTYKSDTGSITSTPSWVSTSSVTLCQDAGINQVIGSDRDILYYSGAWRSYIAG